ncbi:MAG: agmatinase [Candidatus Brockarchaeota archaeon]|nr:agmatinase [Candidatus Brockarchaeota archaeon]
MTSKKFLYFHQHNIFGGLSNKNYEEAKFLVVGIPLDLSGTYRTGYRFAPIHIRQAAAQIEFKSLRYNREVSERDIFDLGDIILGSNLETSLKDIKNSMLELKGEEKIVATIGGEHTITYSTFMGLEAERIIVFDAHFDLRNEYAGMRFSHATWLRRLLENINVEDVLIVGARATSIDEISSNPPNVLYVNPLQLRSEEINFIKDWFKRDKKYYISIDMDCFDPAYAPGVGNPEPEGITPTVFFDFLSKYVSQLNIVGFDVNEVVPPYDLSGITSVLAAKVILEIFNMIISK